MGRAQELQAEDPRWPEVLARVAHDVYHLPGYHRLESERGEGEPRLFVYEQRGELAAFPLLLRGLDGLPGLAGASGRDATSVYGYPGPVASAPQDPDLARGFAAAFHDYLAAQGVVSLFTRLNPLLDQVPLLAPLGGEIHALGDTVSIDLTRPEEAQWAGYSSGHRTEIRRAAREGLECARDPGWAGLDDFHALYTETMQRVGAREIYSFPRAYFARIADLLGDGARLYLARLDGRVVAGAVVLTAGGPILQYHLAGSAAAARRLAPGKALIDLARREGVADGAAVFHLGGGVGSAADTLFRFKRGFGDRTHPFRTWRSIRDPAAHAALSQALRDHHAAAGLTTDPDYFPAYRSPARRPPG